MTDRDFGLEDYALVACLLLVVVMCVALIVVET